VSARITRADTPSNSGGAAARRPRRRWQPAVLFMVPSFLILGIFVIYPIVQSFLFSFQNVTIGGPTQWIGLGNYVALVQDPQFWNALGITLIFTVASVAILVVVGFVLAMLVQGEGIATRLVRSVLFFPTIVSLVTIGLVWKFLLDPSIGFVGGIFDFLGLPPVAWLQSTSLALPTVIFVNIWKNLGFAMILLLAGLKGVPQERYEAARIDGAKSLQLVRFITIPGIRPTLLFTTLILTIQTLQVFDLVYVMTDGGPIFTTDTLVNLLYRDAFTNYQTGYASAVSVVLFVIIVVISALQLRFFRYNDVD
jgi:multiple sugar transport system permease protein/raffinose/stachyose/melibiose transport system permease protein